MTTKRGWKIGIGVFLLMGLLLVGIFVFVPVIHAAFLEWQLTRGSDAQSVDRVARQLLTLDTDKAKAALSRYAANDELCAFDETHGVFLIHDKDTGKTYDAYVGPQGEPIDTGAPALDAAVAEAIPEITFKSFSIGEPAMSFSSLDLLEHRPDRVDFIFSPPSDGSWKCVRYNFDGDRLCATTHYSITDEQLEAWQRKSDSVELQR